MRTALVLGLMLGIPAAAWSQPYGRPDSFFKKDYLTEERDDSAEAASDAAAQDEQREGSDSWEAPRPALRGQDVAGSNKVRDYRNRTGAFAPTPTSPGGQPGYQAIPLGGGTAIILPDGGALGYGRSAGDPAATK